MWHLRRVGQRRRRRAGRARSPRPPAPRAGSRGHHQLRRRELPYPPRDGACRGQFRSRRRHSRAARHRRVGACPLFDDGRDSAAQRPAAVRRSVDRRLRGRAQRQHLERDEVAARPRPPRVDLSVDQRYRDDHPPRRDLELSYADGPFHRCTEADRGGLFADRDDSGRDDRMPRSARHPATRHGTARRCGDLRERDGRARRRRRHVRARGRTRRTHHRAGIGHPVDPPLRTRLAATLHLRMGLFLAAGFDRRRSFGLFCTQEYRRAARRRVAGRCRHCDPRPRFGGTRGDRLCAGVGHPVRTRHHPVALCRAHLHLAGRQGSPSWA